MHYRVDNPDGSFIVIDSGLPLTGATEITSQDIAKINELGVASFERDDTEGVRLKPAVELNEIAQAEEQAKKESDPNEKVKQLESKLDGFLDKQTNKRPS